MEKNTLDPEMPLLNESTTTATTTTENIPDQPPKSKSTFPRKRHFIIFSLLILWITISLIPRNFSILENAYHGIRRPFVKPDTSIGDEPQPEEEYTYRRPLEPCPLSNVLYDTELGRVVCYPSTGGVWMASLSPVGLQYLEHRPVQPHGTIRGPGSGGCVLP